MDTRMMRALALADKLRIRIPDDLANILPSGKLIQKIGEVGLFGAEACGYTGVTEFMGEVGSIEGTAAEFKTLVFSLVNEEITVRDLPLDSLIQITQTAAEFMRSDGLLTFTEVSMDPRDSADVRDDLVKWPTHFSPLDTAFGGKVYQGILTLMGKPGFGKTSLILSIMNEIRRHETASSQWFFQMEVPAAMLQWRIHQMNGACFTKADRLITGVYTMAEILKMNEASPDTGRIIYIDGPDVMAGGGDKRRFDLEQIYRDMVILKQKCKLVVCTSQVRKNDRVLSQESVAEAWAKSWYSDMICGITRIREGSNGNSSVLRLAALKNRFGPNNGQCSFRYDYADLSWRMGSQEGVTPGDDW